MLSVSPQKCWGGLRMLDKSDVESCPEKSRTPLVVSHPRLWRIETHSAVLRVAPMQENRQFIVYVIRRSCEEIQAVHAAVKKSWQFAVIIALWRRDDRLKSIIDTLRFMPLWIGDSLIVLAIYTCDDAKNRLA